MSGHFKILQSLRETGHRLTPQRLMILSTIHEHQGHITAEEVCEKIHQEYPYLDISTVYRTLELLKGLGLVTRTDLGGGRAVYEMATECHHHLVCQRCGGTVALHHRFLEPLEAELLEKFGFAAKMNHLAIFGLCAQCREALSSKEEDDALRS